MATRQAEAMAIVARARKVGWPVEQITDGWRITCPDKVRVQVHLTPSDGNHVKVIMRNLNAHGFAEAEAAVLAAEEAVRAEKARVDLERNEAKLKAVKERAEALSRAAGPYGAAQVTIEQLLAPHAGPAVYHRVLITPEMAERLLERNTHNRPTRRGDIAEWSSALRTGRWIYTHQGVALDSNGVLQDGQHRLMAIVATGIAAEMMVSCGMPPEAFAVIDVGRRRTAAQVLGLDGVSNSALVAVVLRLLHLYEVWGPSTLDHTTERVGNDQIVDVMHRVDADVLLRAVRAAYRVRNETGQSATGVAAGLYLIFLVCGAEHDAAAHEFVEDLVSGRARGEGDPVHALRRQLLQSKIKGPRMRLTPAQAMALVIRAWNDRVAGRTRVLLSVRANSSMPEPQVPTRAAVGVEDSEDQP